MLYAPLTIIRPVPRIIIVGIQSVVPGSASARRTAS